MLKQLSFALLLSASLLAQEKPAATDPKADSKEAFVFRQLETVVAFEKDGTGTRQHLAVVQMVSEAGAQQFGVLRFGYAAANEDLEIAYVRVRKPDGTVVPTPLEQAQDMPMDITRAAPFYSDLREKHLAVKALAPGDTLEYQATTRVKTPPVLGQFWFEYNFNKENLVQSEQLAITLPSEVGVKVKSPDIKPSIAEQPGKRVYTWKTANLKPAKKESSEAETSEADQFPAVQVSSFANWEVVGKWYGGLQDERAVPDASVRGKAAELTKDAKTDAERVRAIYKYVAAKFRYVGVAFGIGRYQPHSAAEVLSNQYGDCKDKHTLLAALLKAVGLKAYPALIHAGRKIDLDVPSPIQFNHVISVVPVGGELVWLDTTAELAPFGLLISELRDKEALVIPSAEPTSFKKTPADPPFKSLDDFEVEGKLDEQGTLQAKVKRKLRGDAELLLRLAFRRTPETSWSQVVQSLSYFSGFGGTVSNVQVSALEATDAPLELSYDYTRKNYSNWENRLITPPFPQLVRSLSDETPARKKPIVLGAPGESAYRAKIELPAGPRPRLPSPVSLKGDFAEYTSTYHFSSGTLTADRRLTIKLRELPASRQSEHREFEKAIDDDERSYISLKATDDAGSSSATSENSEADRLFDEARLAIQRQDATAALNYARQAVAIDPKHPHAWTALGMAQAARGDIDRAIESMRKQVEVSPEEPAGYKVLASLLTALKRHDEAISVWRDLLKNDPQDGDAAASLAGLLMQKKRYAEAASELETAAKLNPKSSAIQQTLGAALLRTGKEEQAMQVLQKAIKLDDSSPNSLNNVAWALAEANIRLAEAQRYAEMAVRGQEVEIEDIDLDTLKVSDLNNIRGLGAYWDTLGWVHFRRGNLLEAEKYLRAAWTLSQSPAVGDHLGQMYEEKQQKRLAGRHYALALAGIGVMPETRQRLNRLVGSTQADRMIQQARGELGRLRTVRVKPARAVKGSAEFFVLFGPDGKAEDAKYVSGTEGLRLAASSLRSLKLDLAIPPGSTVRLVRRGILMCTVPSAGCDFVLLTPDSVHSVD